MTDKNILLQLIGFFDHLIGIFHARNDVNWWLSNTKIFIYNFNSIQDLQNFNTIKVSCLQQNQILNISFDTNTIQARWAGDKTTNNL